MAVLLANNASSKLAASVGVDQTAISVTPGEGSKFPSPTGEDWFPVTLIKSTGEMEICRCTGRNGDALTISRGQEGTPTREFDAGDRIELRLTAGTMNQVTDSLEEYTNEAIGSLGDASHVNRGDLVPPGVIWMWSGAIPNIPPGWALCDGSNGTPDLRGLFVVGAGGSYGVGDKGGANSVTLTTAQMPAHGHTGSTGSAGAHTHSGTANTAGGHNHLTGTRLAPTVSQAVRDAWANQGLVSQSVFQAEYASVETNNNINNNARHLVQTSSAGAHTHSLSINSGGAHTHTVSVGNTGGGQAHENRPPYYALAFIMRLAWS